jgi:hypothetical protein
MMRARISQMLVVLMRTRTIRKGNGVADIRLRPRVRANGTVPDHGVKVRAAGPINETRTEIRIVRGAVSVHDQRDTNPNIATGVMTRKKRMIWTTCGSRKRWIFRPLQCLQHLNQSRRLRQSIVLELRRSFEE